MFMTLRTFMLWACIFSLLCCLLILFYVLYGTQLLGCISSLFIIYLDSNYKKVSFCRQNKRKYITTAPKIYVGKQDSC